MIAHLQWLTALIVDYRIKANLFCLRFRMTWPWWPDRSKALFLVVPERLGLLTTLSALSLIEALQHYLGRGPTQLPQQLLLAFSFTTISSAHPPYVPLGPGRTSGRWGKALNLSIKRDIIAPLDAVLDRFRGVSLKEPAHTLHFPLVDVSNQFNHSVQYTLLRRVWSCLPVGWTSKFCAHLTASLFDETNAAIRFARHS